MNFERLFEIMNVDNTMYFEGKTVPKTNRSVDKNSSNQFIVHETGNP